MEKGNCERSVGHPWKLVKRVLPQHTDHAGVMWHGAYFNWLEEARVEALAEVGLLYKDLSAQGFELPVVSLKINYLSAVFHGEEVVLESRSLPRKLARWPWITKFLRSGVLVAEAWVDLVLVKKVREENHLIKTVPHHISSYLQKLQFGPDINN